MSDSFFDTESDYVDNYVDYSKKFLTDIENLEALNRDVVESVEETLRYTVEWLEKLYDGYPPIQFLEKVLSYYKEIRQRIITNSLPSIMHELGTSKATLDTGETIELRTDVSVSCPKEQKHRLYDWLSKEGHQDEIKTKVEFNKGDFTEDVERRLDESGMPFTVTQDVHAQTLKRIFRERMEEGKPVPDASIAKVTTFEYAKVK